MLNDADAAGLAEVDFGAAKGRDGVVILTTLGTGIGTALLLDGKLVPNTELGHLEIDGVNAESPGSAAAKEREALSYKQWARGCSLLRDHRLPVLPRPDHRRRRRQPEVTQFPALINIRAEMVPASWRTRRASRGRPSAAAEQV